MKCQLVVTSWATPSDEAFTLLVLENNWQLWLEQAKVLFEQQVQEGHRAEGHFTADPGPPMKERTMLLCKEKEGKERENMCGTRRGQSIPPI
jgi:hypothetical protein